MSSLDKSMAIDYYREITDRCICTIGKCQSDYDAILTSNVGVSLEAPKNINTIFSHFYSMDSSVLSIKNIIREGRIYGENSSLLKLACFIYSIILNIYIIVCFFLEYEEYVIKKAFLEIIFFILSITAFTTQSENFNISNCLIQNKKLYYYHYLSQEIGILILKIVSLLFQSLAFKKNPLTDEKNENKIICSYYYLFCFEQIFSIVFTINHIYFYRKNPLYNSFFVVLCLIVLINGLAIFTLNSSNFKFDILSLEFEFNEDLIDSIGDERKFNYFLLLFADFVICFIYSRIIQFIFDKIAQKKSHYILS
jgi:magnesium-transporting ATPase (P-type)